MVANFTCSTLSVHQNASKYPIYKIRGFATATPGKGTKMKPEYKLASAHPLFFCKLHTLQKLLVNCLHICNKGGGGLKDGVCYL